MSDINSENNPKEVRKKTVREKWIPFFGFLVILVLGILIGVGSGFSQRKAAQATVVTGQVEEQFKLGMDAMNTGKYDLAFQHFQFVAQNAPDYPGLREALTQLALWISKSPTPTPSQTPTLTPTPDLRGVEAIFAQIQEYIKNKDWNNALNSLDALRKADPTYKTVVVDGMYYVSLRSRGMANIFPAKCSDTNLEGGIYDLTLAEKFGPLGGDAESAREYARYFLAGSAFWEVDWAKAQYYFSQVDLVYPNLMDSSCVTAMEHWRKATIEYAKQLLAAGDYCNAQIQFDAAFGINSNDNVQYYPTATEVYLQCFPPTPTRVPQRTPTETPTPTPTP